ncbi:hypothetical protein [Acinetobacter sp. MD2(2019)]|uniref:hypothetical protein n=1 Tax=Acinetobacter sp. MD2(2019) TaxID=2605273 RepID=UPI002D1EBBEE|nr:hypothetical protein [Acinetobacter sp. MD2(2019)]MEB3754486.1 hypothetical protein [Acinetobacter sp. MD2(2019)]
MNMHERSVQTEAGIFALASQLYVRLRRVTGRVIDVAYLEQNQHYANEIIRIASQAPDAEVQQLAQRLRERIPTISNHLNNDHSSTARAEAAADEVFKAEVPHHYIGALR